MRDTAELLEMPPRRQPLSLRARSEASKTTLVEIRRTRAAVFSPG